MKFVIEVIVSHNHWQICGIGNKYVYINSYCLDLKEKDYNKVKQHYLKTNLKNFFIRFEKYRQQKEG
jgi:hypothetical protein